MVFHDTGHIRLDDVDEPEIEQPTDVILRATAAAICGTDNALDAYQAFAERQPGWMKVELKLAE